MTTALIESLRLNKHNIDVKNLYLDVVAFLKQNGMEQIPQFSSSSQKPVFQITRQLVINTSVTKRVSVVMSTMQNVMKGVRV